MATLRSTTSHDFVGAVRAAIDHGVAPPRHYHHTPRTHITDANTMPNPPAWIYAIKTAHRHQQWQAKMAELATGTNTPNTRHPTNTTPPNGTN